MSDSFCDPIDIAHQASLSMGFPRQEYWSKLPFSPPRDLPNPGIEPGCPALQANSLPSEPPGNTPLFNISEWPEDWGEVIHLILSYSYIWASLLVQR